MSFNNIGKKMVGKYIYFLIQNDKLSLVLIFLFFCYMLFSYFNKNEEIIFPHDQVKTSIGIIEVEKRTRGTDAFSFKLYEGGGYNRYSVRGDYRFYKVYDGDRVRVKWVGVNFLGVRSAFEIYTVSDNYEYVKKILDYDKSLSWYFEKKKSSRFYSIFLPLFLLVLLIYNTFSKFNKEKEL